MTDTDIFLKRNDGNAQLRITVNKQQRAQLGISKAEDVLEYVGRSFWEAIQGEYGKVMPNGEIKKAVRVYLSDEEAKSLGKKPSKSKTIFSGSQGYREIIGAPNT